MEGIKSAKQELKALLDSGAIAFDPFSWAFGYVDMEISSQVFTDHSFRLSVPEEDWEGGPADSVCDTLYELLETGALHLAEGYEYIRRREH